MSRARRPADEPSGSAREAVWYVYGIVPAGSEPMNAPEGIGGARVSVISRERLAALVSQLDAAEYSEETIEAGVGEVTWIAGRAQAHDDVITWASQPGPIVPLHMWTLFSDSESVEEMLQRRQAELATLLERLRGSDEYGLRVFADAAALEAAAGEDPTLAELGRSADAAGPGRRYLLERKMDTERKEATRALARSLADEIFVALESQSVAASRDAIPAAGSAGAGAILSAAFLVRRDGVEGFRRTLTDLTRAHAPRLRFEFTGPWPPYHFVAGADE